MIQNVLKYYFLELTQCKRIKLYSKLTCLTHRTSHVNAVNRDMIGCLYDRRYDVNDKGKRRK